MMNPRSASEELLQRVVTVVTPVVPNRVMPGWSEREVSCLNFVNYRGLF